MSSNPWHTLEREAELTQRDLAQGTITLEEAQDHTFTLLRVIASLLSTQFSEAGTDAK